MKAVWTKARAEAVNTAFLATKHPAASDLSAKVVQALGGYADSLATMRTRACRATAFEGESDALLTLRHTCTSRRVSDLDALVKGLELALEGPRHESQRAKARALAGQEASADSKRLHRK